VKKCFEKSTTNGGKRRRGGKEEEKKTESSTRGGEMPPKKHPWQKRVHKNGGVTGGDGKGWFDGGNKP